MWHIESRKELKMKKRTFQLVTGIVTGVATIASAIVVFIAPPMAPAIVAGIEIIAGAAIEICSLFEKDE